MLVSNYNFNFQQTEDTDRLLNEKSFLMLALAFFSSSSVASMLMNRPSVNRCASDTNSLFWWHNRCTSISSRSVADFCHQQLMQSISQHEKQIF